MPVPMGDFWASFFLSVVVGRPMFFSFCLLKAWFARFCWGVWRAILESGGCSWMGLRGCVSEWLVLFAGIRISLFK